MRKRILATVLCICFILGMAQVAVAANVSTPGATTPQTRWTHTSSIAMTLSLSNGTVHWSGCIIGHPGTTGIVASYTLEKSVGGRWTFVDSWPDLKTSSSILTSSGSAAGTSGLYRLTVSTTVTRNGASEFITLSHEKAL